MRKKDYCFGRISTGRGYSETKARIEEEEKASYLMVMFTTSIAPPAILSSPIYLSLTQNSSTKPWNETNSYWDWPERADEKKLLSRRLYMGSRSQTNHLYIRSISATINQYFISWSESLFNSMWLTSLQCVVGEKRARGIPLRRELSIIAKIHLNDSTMLVSQ